jgi:YegS/Rv2252/BmrU family lipid kinase
MPIGIIINPISGAGGRRATAGPTRRRLAERGARAAGVHVEIALTEHRGHAAALAAGFVARGMDVVVWGGDGTVNEAAGPLIGTQTTLGIVPSGSGDGLARSLEVPLATDDALQVALTGRASAIDVGYLGDRHFLNIGGIGFDAVIAARFNQLATRGVSGYITSGLRLVWSYAAARYQVELGDTAFEGEKFLIGFANGREYGNGIVLAPDAIASDGWLDVVIVDGGSPLRQLWRARRLAVGRRRPAEGLLRTRVQRARVSGDRMVCHVDGETFEASGELAIRIAARALRIRSGATGATRASGA